MLLSMLTGVRAQRIVGYKVKVIYLQWPQEASYSDAQKVNVQHEWLMIHKCFDVM